VDEAGQESAVARGGRRTGAQGLRRPRLLALLRPADRLTVVVAPAGSGKTTLLSQYAEQLAGTTVWYRAGRQDGDPERFADAVLRAVASAGLPRSGPLPRDLPELAGLLAAAEPVTLVVDDAHLLLDTPAEQHLERLVADGPDGLSVVLASRRAPGLNLCRAELGEVTVVTADDLRFRSWEVESLFRDHYREPLPPDDIAALTRRTDGWAACLRLFQLSTRSRPLPERRRAVGALACGPRYARSYLARTILDELSEDLRTFLSRTAVFEVLTADRCDRLLGTTDAQARLEQLDRLEVLTTSDDGGRTFRYHEVLRGHLESALVDELGPRRTRAWYATAAAMLEEQGALGEALRAWLRAERWDEVARLLRDDGRTIAAEAARNPAVPLWSELLPPALVDEDPWLSTAVARRLTAEGRLVAAARRYRHAEGLFPDSADRVRVSRERRLVELWTTGRPQPHLHWMDRLRAAVRRRPGDVCPPPGRAPGPGDHLCSAVVALLTGDVRAASASVGRLLEDPAVDGPLLLAGRLVQELVDVLRGADVAVGTDRLGAEAERAGATWVARQARVLHALALRDGPQVVQVADECAAVADEWGELLARTAEAVRRLLAGEHAAATCRDLQARAEGIGAGSVAAWIAAAGALAAAAEGAPDAPERARAAAAAGRGCGVPGTQALTALAVADVAKARALAAEHGLPWPSDLEQRLIAPAIARTGLAAASAPHAPPAVVRCFGGFEIAVGGRPLDWRSLRPRAACALRLLAARSPHAVHREVLLTLWPGLPPGQATHGLQVAMSTVRAFLAPDAPRGSARMVDRVGETYALVLPPGSSSDVLDLGTALEAAHRAARDGDPVAERSALAVALTTYRGELLPEDGPAEWVVADREQWRLRVAAAAARLADLHLGADDPRAAVEAARRGLEIDPFCDPLWRTLVAGHARTGDTAAEAKARREYAAVLNELGVLPPPRVPEGRVPLLARR
jgi:DNA-binding SARP family transcriptional activator